MKRITIKTLEKLGFKKFEKQTKHYPIHDNVWYIRHFADHNHLAYHEYHFEINERLENQPMSGALSIYHKEQKNIAAPTEKDLNRTIALSERTHYFAYYIKYEFQLKKLIKALELGPESRWEN